MLVRIKVIDGKSVLVPVEHGEDVSGAPVVEIPMDSINHVLNQGKTKSLEITSDLSK